MSNISYITKKVEISEEEIEFTKETEYILHLSLFVLEQRL